MESDKIRYLINEAQRKNVATLDLSREKLTFLPPETSELRHLTELGISRNQLTSLPPEIPELKNLRKLNVSHNKLILLPPEISELKNLTELSISFNQLTSLPPEISELKNLTSLDISGNQLTSLPPEISELKSLVSLFIFENKLTSLPSGIIELKNLNSLFISFNQLTSLPPEILELKNLRRLEINGNQLISLPSEISELKNLTSLDISRNQLTSLPSEISELKNLTELSISFNQLTSLPPEISELKNLRRLEISGNQLTRFPFEVSELKNLKKLDVSNNQLTSLPPGILELKDLTQLNIAGNKLTILPPEILELDLEIEWIGKLKKRMKGKAIYLQDNPFENPPVEIIKKGREAVRNYFKSLEGEQKPLNEVKFLLVGEGGAGKTSLVKRLFNEEVDGNEPQTQGINIRKLIVENGEREIKANFWDFGGQEIMHATHQFFLSKRSLYILVLDGRKDEKPEYWLKLIEYFGGESPVLIVINKIDENPAFELNRKFLREKYPFIRGKGFFRLSCTSNVGVEEFSEALQEELTKIKHLEIKWPKSWFNVKSKLEKLCPNCPSNNMGEDSCKYFNFIEYKEYKKMCDDEGIKSKSEQGTLLSLIHI